MLELKSNTIHPINSNKSSKNDHFNINNNLDIHEQNSTIRLITKTYSTSLRDSTIQKTPTIVTPTKPTISNCADVVLYAKTVLGNHKLMSNNINKVKRKCDICNNKMVGSDELLHDHLIRHVKNHDPIKLVSM